MTLSKNKKGKVTRTVKLTPAEHHRRASAARWYAARDAAIRAAKAWRPKQSSAQWRPAGTGKSGLDYKSASNGGWVPPDIPMPQDTTTVWQRLGLLAAAAAAPLIIGGCLATGLLACAAAAAEGELAAASGGSILGIGGLLSAGRAMGSSQATNGAENVVNGTRLAQQLARESADSVFTSSGRLSSGAIADSLQIIPGSRLGNKDLIQRLTSDGSNIAD